MPTEAEIDAQWKEVKQQRAQSLLDLVKQHQADRMKQIALGIKQPQQEHEQGLDLDDDSR